MHSRRARAPPGGRRTRWPAGLAGGRVAGWSRPGTWPSRLGRGTRLARPSGAGQPRCSSLPLFVSGEHTSVGPVAHVRAGPVRRVEGTVRVAVRDRLGVARQRAEPLGQDATPEKAPRGRCKLGLHLRREVAEWTRYGLL